MSQCKWDPADFPGPGGVMWSRVGVRADGGGGGTGGFQVCTRREGGSHGHGAEAFSSGMGVTEQSDGHLSPVLGGFLVPCMGTHLHTGVLSQ